MPFPLLNHFAEQRRDETNQSKLRHIAKDPAHPMNRALFKMNGRWHVNEEKWDELMRAASDARDAPVKRKRKAEAQA